MSSAHQHLNDPSTPSSIIDAEETRVLVATLASYYIFPRTAHQNLSHRRRSAFYALPNRQQALLARAGISYPQILDTLDKALAENAEITQYICHTAITAFDIDAATFDDPNWTDGASAGDVEKVRSTLKQLFRDWSVEGKAERACYGEVVSELEEWSKEHEREKGSVKVLVPGAGLGRLAFDICLAGFESQGNEFSYHQLMASNFILNHTKRANQHTIHPWLSTFSNHRSREDQFASVTIPDVHPASMLAGTGADVRFSMTAGDFVSCYSTHDASDSFDAVATVFFIDTAVNIVVYLDTIWNCLKMGGCWINYGPLLWHYEDNPQGTKGREEAPGLELCLDELLALAKVCGFEVQKRRTLQSEYTGGAGRGMLRHTYEGEFWVAKKVERIDE